MGNKKTPQELIADAMGQSLSITTDESACTDSDMVFLSESGRTLGSEAAPSTDPFKDMENHLRNLKE